MKHVKTLNTRKLQNTVKKGGCGEETRLARTNKFYNSKVNNDTHKRPFAQRAVICTL